VNRSPHLGVTVSTIKHLIARTLLRRRPIRWLLFAWADWRITHSENARRAQLSFPPSAATVVLGWSWILVFLDWLATALAVMLGAPFWFDLLNKFMVIRSTVKPAEKSQPQPSKDRPAPKTETDSPGGGDGRSKD
jgi:hypothetical protein